MIEIKGITKKFNNVKVLDNIIFTVENGELIGLLGENGAGKSTLLRIISTTLSPDDGTVLVNGYDIRKSKKHVRDNIGIL